MTHKSTSDGKLIPRMRARLRVMRYSPRTEARYVDWVVRYVRFHEMRHPKELGARDVEEFLTFLATVRHVAASTQNQALAALLYLYKEVLRQPLGYVDDIVRAKRPTRVPVVLTRDEVRRVLVVMAGTPQMVAQLLYGSGLRLMEACTLRVKDVDLERREVTVRGGKGSKDRRTMLSAKMEEVLCRQTERVRGSWRSTCAVVEGTSTCRRLMGASPRRRRESWAGSGYSPHRGSMWTSNPANAAGIMCTKRWCSGP